MQSDDGPPTPVESGPQCEDCQAALESGGRQAVSFLLVDTLTVPLVGCEAHLEQFRAICELTSEEPAKLLSHLPAGGIQCLGCQHADRSPGIPVVFLEAGAVGVLACEAHSEDVLDRFQSGLHTRHQFGIDGRF